MVRLVVLMFFFFEILHRPNYQAQLVRRISEPSTHLNYQPKNLVIAGFRQNHRFSRYWWQHLFFPQPYDDSFGKLKVFVDPRYWGGFLSLIGGRRLGEA